MKKLFLALALLMIGFGSQGAFATCNSATDKFNTAGWCIDQFGAFTPKAITTGGTQTGTQGQSQVPVLTLSTANTPQTLTAQQSGLYATDSGGVTTDTLTGFGSKWTLPRATVGLVYSLSVGSKSFVTLDTLDTSDTFLYSISGTGFQMGDSMKSTGQAGDSVTVTCNKAGTWSINDMHGAWTNNGTN